MVVTVKADTARDEQETELRNVALSYAPAGHDRETSEPAPRVGWRYVETAQSYRREAESRSERGTIPTLRLPEGWKEQRVQITWVAPAESVEGQMPRQDVRRNIVLSVAPAESGMSFVEVREKFLEQTRLVIPGLTEIEREDEVAFTDGKLGGLLVVEFQANPDIRLRQTHLFRVDEENVVQLAVTVNADTARDEQETELRNVALSYAPAG